MKQGEGNEDDTVQRAGEWSPGVEGKTEENMEKY